MSLYYTDQPVFGFDIGRSSIKIMQIDPLSKKKEKSVVQAYGNIGFDPKAIDKGVIVEPEIIIKAAHDLMNTSLVGTLNTRYIAMSLPNSHSFSRVISLPSDIKEEDIEAAVQAEIAESIPVPLTELIYDFEETKILEDGNREVQLVASPSRITESYTQVAQALGLTPAAIEPNINSVTRMVVHSEAHEAVSMILDLGSEATDLSVYDRYVVRVTGSVDCGGEHLTRAIAAKLQITERQAHSIKTRYGLGVSKKQAEILEALEPELNRLVREIKKVMRYYADRASDGREIGQIIILGGGANLPGLSAYITNQTRVPTRLNAPWTNLDFGSLKPPHELETTIYTTAGGLSLIHPEELSS